MKPHVVLLCFSFFVLACSNSNTEQPPASSGKGVPSAALPIAVSIDTIEPAVVKVEKPVVKQMPKSVSKEVQIRMGEIVSDAKLNGEPILIQEELLPETLSANPDRIKELVKSHYQNNERNFPRSIADNFEKGTSTERIHYPLLFETYEDPHK